MATFKPEVPLLDMIRLFTAQAETQLLLNMHTQRVWPTEVYKGYAQVNEIRKKRGQWNSTGAGFQSFRTSVVANAPENVSVIFSFLDYLRYVDIGVGQGTHAEDVERGRNANFKRRYISSWNRRENRSHRPFLMMELRHLGKRIEDYLTNYYGYKGHVWIGAIEKGSDGKIKIKVLD